MDYVSQEHTQREALELRCGNCSPGWLFVQPWTHTLIPGWLNPGATNYLGPCRWGRGPTGKAGVRISRNDWPILDPRGGAIRWVRPRRLGEERTTAGGDWLHARAGRPGKGRRKETRAGRAAARRRRRLSWWWQRRKRQLQRVVAALRAGCGSGLGWRYCSVRRCWARPLRPRVSIRPLGLEARSHRPPRPPSRGRAVGAPAHTSQ